MFAQRLIRIYGSVGEDEILRLYRVGNTRKKAPLGIEFAPYLLLACRKAADFEKIKSGGVEHVPEYAALLVHDIVHEVLVTLISVRMQINSAPVVAVSAYDVHISAAAELHDVAQSAEAVRTLLKKITVDNKLIVLTKGGIFQCTLEILEIAVNIRYDEDASIRGKAQTFDYGRACIRHASFSRACAPSAEAVRSPAPPYQ